MNAHKFIASKGIDIAKAVITSVPDKTATHWEFRKIPNYYSIDFQTWFHDGEWHDSDCQTEEELIDSYGEDFVVNLSELKQVVESIEIVNRVGGIECVNQILESAPNSWCFACADLRKREVVRSAPSHNDFVYIAALEKSIADYELVESYKRDN